MQMDVQVRIAAGAAIMALALTGCGGLNDGEETVENPGPDATAAPEPVTVPTEPVQEHLPIADEDQPIVWVRGDRHVDLFDEPGGKVVATVGDHTEFGSRTVYAVFKTHGNGWAGVSTPHMPNNELAWVRLDPDRMRSGKVSWALDIDLSEYRAKLVLGGKVVRTFTVSIGMPGAETPTGRFAVTDTFRGDLNPAYGCCALALTAKQLRLPSGWLGGNRIAIHGTDGPLGSPVSHGCIRAANVDVSELVTKLPLGTPVTIVQ
jgi:lipoprotein-anchoring transpeptidase ErfK/SrfK